MPVVGGCLFSDDDAEALNVYGYRYQCRGVFRYTIEAGSMSEEVAISYGNSAGRKLPKARPNDPCPCGSGKRYKKFHGKKAKAEATASA